MKKKNSIFGLGSIGQRHLRNIIKLEKRLKLYAVRKLNKTPLLDSKNNAVKVILIKNIK